MAVASHKRALSSGVDPVLKKLKVEAHVEAAQYVYITLSTKNTVHEYANNAVETTTTYHNAYQTQKDADNALKSMANERYPFTEWYLDRGLNGQLTLSSAEDDDRYYPEDDVNLKVQRIMLMPPGCTSRVRVLRLADPGVPDQQEGGEEESSEEEEDKSEEADEESSDEEEAESCNEEEEDGSENEPEVADEDDDELEIGDAKAIREHPTQERNMIVKS